MKISRALLVLPVLALAACGASHVVPSAGEAHTMACRGYLLTIGNTDTKHATELVQQAPYSGDEIDTDANLAKVRAAAAAAGATAGLSDGDFAKFRKVVEVIDGLPSKKKALDDGTGDLPAAALTPLLTSANAIHKLCY